MKNLWVFLIGFCPNFSLIGQDASPREFGDVRVSDFHQSSYAIDSTAGAIVLFDKGHTEVVSSRKQGFDQRVVRHKRVHILKSSGFDAAQMELLLLKDNDHEDKLKHLEAVTYYLEGDQVVAKKLDKKNIHKVNKNNHQHALVFSLPQVKENTIIEISYTYVTFLHTLFHPWSFQDQYPVIWSEYEVRVPSFIVFTYTLKGYRPCDVDTSYLERTSYTFKGDYETLNLSDLSVKKRWVMKNVLPINETLFTSSPSNYQPALSFQFIEVKEPFTPFTMVSNWDEFYSAIMESKYFGKALEGSPKFATDLLKKLQLDGTDDLKKAHAIYNFIRDSIQNNGNRNVFINSTLENVAFWRTGERQELNLLLILLYKIIGLDAVPVLVSTKSNGKISLEYPNIEEFNHVVCHLKLKEKSYIIDASDNYLSFGYFLEENYNGYANELSDKVHKILLDPDSIFQKETILYSVKKGTDFTWKSTVEYKTSDASAHSLRRNSQLKESAVGLLVSNELGIINAQKTEIDSLKNLNFPIHLRFHFEESMSEDSLVYFSPFQYALTRENPFKSKERKLPVEYPYLKEEQYVAIIEIPEGYRLESLPLSKTYQLDEEQSLTVETKWLADSKKITARSKIKFKKSFYEPEEFEALRETYDFIVNQHAENIVFKKL